MDARIKGINITPARFDNEGMISHGETARITLDVPLDSQVQRAALLELMDVLDTEWVRAEISSRQQRIELDKAAD